MILALECTVRESRPAVRPRANHAGRRIVWWFTPRLTALGLDGGRARLLAKKVAVTFFGPTVFSPAITPRRLIRLRAIRR